MTDPLRARAVAAVHAYRENPTGVTTMSDPDVRAVLLGLGNPASERDRAHAVGATMDLRAELERLRTLALDVDATLRTLKLLADRDRRVNAKTIYNQLERARARSLRS